MGRPKARRQNARGLSRRRKFAQGRSVRVFRGCGFYRSNGTLPLALCPSAPCGRRLVEAASASCVSRRRGRAHSAASTRLGHPLAHQPGPSAEPRRDGVGASASPPDGAGRVGSQSTWHWGALHSRAGRPRGISRGRKKRAATASSAGRRLPRRPRRALPRAGDGWLPPCGFSHRAEAMALLWRTRDGTSTAARLRRGLLA